MAQTIHVALPDADRTPEPTQARFDRLLEHVSHGDNLLAELTAPGLNISHLIACDGAAVTLGGAVRSLGERVDRLALHLSEELQDNPASEVYLTQQWRPAQAAEPDAVRYQSILAVRFNRSEAGWLFWFRKRDVAWRPEPWSESDTAIAQRLRVELLEICLAQATQTSRVQHRLIRKMTHDLSNPLQSISMSASLLQAEGKRNLDLRKRITGATAKLHALVADVREMDRLCECADDTEQLPTDVSALVDNLLRHTHDKMPELTLHAGVEADLHARLDPARFVRLVGILLDNAQRHRVPDSPVQLSLFRTGQSVCLAISNQTQPLTNSQLRSLLHPTSRQAAMNDDCSQGVGLYIASAIARALQGSLDVRQLDGWITFTLHLPLSSRPVSR